MALAAPLGIAMISESYLRAVQYLSPAFPIGSFAYSQGLEYAISAGLVTDSTSLQDWIAAQLAHGSARVDAILVAHATHGHVQGLADLTYALASSAERDLELRDMGRAYAAQMAHLTGTDFPALPLPVAIGLSMRGLDVPLPDILALFLQGFAAQMISVGVRFIPLGQSAGQAILAGLGSYILQTARDAATASLDDIATTTIGADMASMAHETQEVRIYRT
jgi:urease accessory protein